MSTMAERLISSMKKERALIFHSYCQLTMFIDWKLKRLWFVTIKIITIIIIILLLLIAQVYRVTKKWNFDMRLSQPLIFGFFISIKELVFF